MNERLWRRVDKQALPPAHCPEMGSCWVWTGKVKNGYATISIGSRSDGTRRTEYVHRLAYEELVGPITDGLELDHLCRVRLCVRPTHLEPVTHEENVLRGDSFTAVNARKTHCPQQHPYDEANTWISSSGWRYCRACNRDKARRRYANAKLAPEVGVG